MSKISEYLNKIKTAIYGREVRDAIHDSIKECYADVTSSATLANEASDKANAATEKANTAASNADAATASANSATNLANAAASNADNKAALADRATANANAATESANAAASNATDKAALADTAATGATAAMNSANEAASNANGKATLANEATANANAATESANTAASNADNKAALADKATTNANSAANLANTAATTADNKAALADNAAGLIRRMDVSTTHLPPGSAPTSSLNTVEDASGLSHYSLVLGIPTGNTGVTPALTFEVSTGEAGTSATVEVTGTAEAPIVHLTIPKGDTGKIENLVINGRPVDNGTITLTASDIGALPADTAIPTKTSDLTNDSGFVTADNAPVQSVNGKTGVVSLSAEDVGALSGTDATLTITGRAADAKATGDLVNQLKSETAYVTGNARNGLYRGKKLGELGSEAEWSAFLEKYQVPQGLFVTADGSDALYLGDYVTVKNAGAYSGDWMIAGFNTHKNVGDNLNAVDGVSNAGAVNHIAMIPRGAGFARGIKMNETATTAGGYAGSAMYTYLRETVVPALVGSLGKRLLTRRVVLTNAVETNAKSPSFSVWNGVASGNAWSSSRAELMTEVQVYGTTVWGGGYDTGEAFEKLPVFNFVTPVAFDANSFWLRSVASDSRFASSGLYGYADFYMAFTGSLFVRPLIYVG